MGIKTTTGKEMFIRVLIEGLNYQTRQMIEQIEQAGINIQNVRAIGGATKNSFWMQNRADVLCKPVEVPNIDEATCLGLAMVAGIGVGLYKDEKEAFEKIYKKGRKVSDEELAIVNIERATFHGKWNYTITSNHRAKV